MEKIIVDNEKINAYVKEMSTCLNEFIDEIKIIENKKNSLIWDSDAGKIVMSSYENVLNEYLSFANKMITFVNYLNQFTKNYDESLEQIKNNFSKLQKNLEVNNGKSNS